MYHPVTLPQPVCMEISRQTVAVLPHVLLPLSLLLEMLVLINAKAIVQEHSMETLITQIVYVCQLANPIQSTLPRHMHTMSLSCAYWFVLKDIMEITTLLQEREYVILTVLRLTLEILLLTCVCPDVLSVILVFLLEIGFAL